MVCECDTHARKSKGRGSSEERSEPFCASRFRAGRRGSAFTCIINRTTGVCSYCIWSLPACPKEFWSSFAQVGALSRRCCCCRRCSMIPPSHLSKSRSERGNGNKDPNSRSLHRSISRVDVQGAAKTLNLGCVNRLPVCVKSAHNVLPVSLRRR